MSRKGISRLTLRLALVAAVLACALFACVGSAYAEGEIVPPEKVNGKYEIYNADQLRAFATVTNGSGTSIGGQSMPADKGASCILMADIDFNNTYWSPVIGQQQNSPFTGTFDGNGHTISNYQISGYPYLFGYVKGTIKNLKVDAGTMNITGYVYSPEATVLVRTIQNGGVVINTNVTGDVSMPNTNHASFIAGENYGIIRNCSTHGKLSCNGSSSICDRVWETGVVENCYNTATIVCSNGGVPYGLVYYVQSNTSVVRNCYNVGTMWRSGEGSTEWFGLAESENRLTNCYKSTDTFTAADLGDAFMDDPEGGFPVFPYQLPDGQYPHVEGAEDIEVKKISYVDDTSLSLISDTQFEYYSPSEGDFAIRAIPEDGRVINIPVTSVTKGSKGRISLTFDSIKCANDADGKPLRTNADQEVTVKLLIAGQEKGERKIMVEASQYWSDYIEEPSVITKSDERYSEKFSGYYKITSPEELAWVAVKARDGSFVANCFLANDIYLNDTSDEKWKDSDDKMYWDTPIGTANGAKLSGTFDGNGHKVVGMYFDYEVSAKVSPKSRGAGLFGTVDYVQNLTVEDAVVIGGNLQYAGGIVAYDIYRITNCQFDGTVTGGTYGAGGIVGRTANGYQRFITGCVNKGAITGSNASYTGGICGYHYMGTVESCYNIGKVNGSGIVGYGGENTSNEYINNCYNAGKVGNAIATGGKTNFSNVYTLLGTGPVSGNVDALTEEEFKDGTLLEYLDSENFVADEDNINKGYPVLSWQSPLKEAKESYPDELQYYVDLGEYKVNKAEVQAIIDEAKEKIANANTSAEAAAAFAEAKAAIDAIPSDEQIKQNMADELAELQRQIELANKTLAFDMCLISLDSTEAVYTGAAIEPVVTATAKDGKVLVKDTDFEVAYDVNVAPGVAKVQVTGKGEYAGTRELTFNIAPVANKILKCKKAKKAFTVTWTKDELGTGYEVSYGLKKNFKGAKTVKIAKGETTSKKVSKLKAKKKYFVRVRTYVTSGEQTVYGAWSPVKSVKTM